MNPWISLILALAPEATALIADIKALFVKYPTLTPTQIAAVVMTFTGPADATFDSITSAIAADQAAHKTS